MKKIILTACLLPCVSSLFAQEKPKKEEVVLEELSFIGEKKYAEKKSESAAKMNLKNLNNAQVYTVLPIELMEEQLITDYEDALRSVPGVSNVTYSPGSGGVGLTSYLRGFITKSGAIRNGMYGNFVTLADPFNTERIEVIKGPSGTLFGSTLVSHGGLINQVTKKPLSVFKGSVSYTLGSWNNNRVTADVNLPINEKVVTRVNALYQNSNTFQDYGNFTNMGVASSLSYKVSNKLKFDLDAELFHTDRNTTFMGLRGPKAAKTKWLKDLKLNPEISYANNNILSSVSSFNVYAKAMYKINDNWNSELLISSSVANNDAKYLFLLLNQKNIGRMYMYIPSKFNALNIQYNLTAEHNFAGINNKFLFGVDHTENQSQDNRSRFMDAIEYNKIPSYISTQKFNEKVEQGYFLLNNERKLHTTSFYVSDVLNISSKLIASFGLRYDMFKSKSEDYTAYSQNYFSPKFGLIYQPVKDKLSIFFNYMNGFKNVAPGIANGVTKNFKPEHSNQFEGGVKFELFNKHLSGTLSYYNIQVKDIVRANINKPKDPTAAIQDGTRYSKGVEFDMIANLFRGFHLIVGYGYNESEYTNVSNPKLNGRRPKGVPYNTANFWASYKLNDGLAKGLGFGLGGNMQTDIYFSDASDMKVSGYNKLDAAVFYDKPSYRLSLKVNNFTNQEYFLVGYWGSFQKPREVLANLTIKF